MECSLCMGRDITTSRVLDIVIDNFFSFCPPLLQYNEVFFNDV